jgi:hypothetical protein
VHNIRGELLERIILTATFTDVRQANPSNGYFGLYARSKYIVNTVGGLAAQSHSLSEISRDIYMITSNLPCAYTRLG